MREVDIRLTVRRLVLQVLFDVSAQMRLPGVLLGAPILWVELCVPTGLSFVFSVLTCKEVVKMPAQERSARRLIKRGPSLTNALLATLEPHKDSRSRSNSQSTGHGGRAALFAKCTLSRMPSALCDLDRSVSVSLRDFATSPLLASSVKSLSCRAFDLNQCSIIHCSHSASAHIDLARRYRSCLVLVRAYVECISILLAFPPSASRI